MQYPRLEEALDQAALNGLLRYDESGNLIHVPFSLSPFSISKAELHEMQQLTEPFSEMMLRVSRDRDFIRELLEPLAESDTFLDMLLGMGLREETQSLQLLIQRNDFFLTDHEVSGTTLRQVELNTIAASFPFLIERLMETQRDHFADDSILSKMLVPNSPLEKVVDAMAKAVQSYGNSDGSMLTVIQPNEANRFDQLGLEQKLRKKHGIRCLRNSLEEIGQNGSLKQGHLMLGNNPVALVYYRAGYTPDDFKNPEAKKGRELIEHSSAIQTPDLWMQLAGMKKIQQALTRPEILSQFAPKPWIPKMASTFVKMHSFDEDTGAQGISQKAIDLANKNPESWVLKPQREGGGNNYFGKEMTQKLKIMPTSELKAHVLMERILPRSHPAWLMVQGQSDYTSCVSEIGRYGVLLANRGTIELNSDCGYLVRTKSEDVNEGGVCAGYSCLNTLCLEEEGTP